jgi:hypothetical protein
MKRSVASVALFGALALAVRAAEAQSASITATANVLQPLTVQGQQNLNFGNVYPGTSVTVGNDAAGTGRFRIAGVNGAEVTFNLTLPTNLTSGANSIPITFGSTAGRFNTTNTSGGTSFNPNTSQTTNLHATTGELFVWIGGTVSPSGTTPAGTYTGTITLNASYTGN